MVHPLPVIECDFSFYSSTTGQSKSPSSPIYLLVSQWSTSYMSLNVVICPPKWRQFSIPTLLLVCWGFSIFLPHPIPFFFFLVVPLVKSISPTSLIHTTPWCPNGLCSTSPLNTGDSRVLQNGGQQVLFYVPFSCLTSQSPPSARRHIDNYP